MAWFVRLVRSRWSVVAPLNSLQTLRHDLNPVFTFESLVVGPCNRIANAASLCICDAGDPNPSSDYNPLFVYGGHGTGKTHLLHSTCHRMLETSEKNIIYHPCEEFTNRFIAALEADSLFSFRESYRQAEVLVVDDVGFLDGKEKTQDEFFHTLSDLVDNGTQVLLSCSCSPHDCSGFQSRLVSRLQSGLVVRLDPPDLGTRTEILIRKAKSRDYALPADVAGLIASTVVGDLREVEGALSRVLNAASSNNMPLTLESVRRALHDLIDDPAESSAITVPQILQAVQEYFHLSRKELLSRSKVRSLVYARQTGMYLARELTPLSLEEIGKRFGDRDHTTVLYALNRITEMKNGRPEVKATLRSLRHCIGFHRNG